MQETSPVGNGLTTDSDSAIVEKTGTTPTKAPAPTTVPSQNTPSQNTPSQDTPGPSPALDNAQHFPPTLVGLDPPTLPAADGMKPPHRDVDARGPADLPQFRPFPHPQRSEPGHPGLRRMWKRLITFWRRTKI